VPVSAAALDRTIRLLRGDLFPTLSPECLVEEMSSTRVQLLANADSLASPAAQTALVASFVCLAQLGFELHLQLPDVEVLGTQPPLEGDRLLPALLELGEDLIAPPPVASGEPVAAVVAIGNTPVSERESAASPVFRLGGEAWRGAVGVGADARVEPLDSSLPFGAVLASVVAAAEVLRVICCRIAARRCVAVAAEFDLTEPRPLALSLPPLDLLGGLDLGPFDIVSAGAITNSCAFNLLRVPRLRGRARVFDADRSEESNLNRYPLMRRSQLGEEKVKSLASMAKGDLVIEPVAERLTESLARRLGLRRRVLVGVDHVPSRWIAQRFCPEWLCVAGTTHFTVLVSEHAPGTPCAGCLHPRDDAGGPAELPTISFVSLLAGTLQAHRLLAHASGLPAAPPLLAAGFNLGSPEALTEVGLAANPGCPVGCMASMRAGRRAVA
jgi:molybdopterin/thiamine biosynthesis adenylyltransferase